MLHERVAAAAAAIMQTAALGALQAFIGSPPARAARGISSFTLHTSAFFSLFERVDFADLPSRRLGHAKGLDLERMELARPFAMDKAQVKRRLGGAP